MLQMPAGGIVLTLRMQNDMPHLWVLHPNPQAEVETRIFRLVTTGEEFNPAGCTYIGSFEAQGWFIGHVFEQTDSAEADVVSLRYRDDFRQIKSDLTNTAIDAKLAA